MASSYMVKYLRISSYITIRMPFLIYDIATAPLWITLYMRKKNFPLFYQCMVIYFFYFLPENIICLKRTTIKEYKAVFLYIYIIHKKLFLFINVKICNFQSFLRYQTLAEISMIGTLTTDFFICIIQHLHLWGIKNIRIFWLWSWWGVKLQVMHVFKCFVH